jgi:hypothetical protein
VKQINIRIKRTRSKTTVSSKCKSINCNFINCLDSTFQANEKIKRAQRDLNVANDQLSALNATLQAINLKLKRQTLTEANLVEIYIGRYMDQCSDYIGKLEGTVVN